jgi:hypothetical protein
VSSQSPNFVAGHTRTASAVAAGFLVAVASAVAVAGFFIALVAVAVGFLATAFFAVSVPGFRMRRAVASRRAASLAAAATVKVRGGSGFG